MNMRAWLGQITAADFLAQRCLTYLRCLPLAEVTRYQLISKILESNTATDRDGNDSIAAVMSSVRKEAEAYQEDIGIQATPPVQRASMTVHPWRYLWQRKGTRDVGSEPRAQWQVRAFIRRLLLSLLVFVPALLAAWGFSTVLPYHGAVPLEKIMIGLSALLFAWVSVGFWVATIGFIVLVKGGDRYRLGKDLPHSLPMLKDASARTAILFPICGEDMCRIISGIRSVYDSLQKTGEGAAFDIFILSDTRNPDDWISEELYWRQLCHDLGNPGNIFYRRRKLNLKRKSGNVADFCRRFGRAYKYMIVFDADSVMAGATLTRLVQLMEHHPEVGIIQTLPAVVGRETLYARLQQFASCVYGPIYTAGLHSIQLGDGSFWGHNAILRVEPFMKYCHLPRLSWRGFMGGAILSHDFVESALMRRAGYSNWLAYDLGGSFEEPPPTLIDDLKRDRRWCCGNLQHVSLIFAQGFRSAHRWLFINGILSYCSSALWLLLLLLSTASVISRAFQVPDYFPTAPTLFPQWQVWDPFGPLVLLVITATLMLLPKLLAVIVIFLQRRSYLFGGSKGLLASVLIEILLSAFIAPVKMLFHSRFVVSICCGRPAAWNVQNRDDLSTGWGDAWRFHRSGCFIALVWGTVMWFVNPIFLAWISPVLIPLICAVPLSVLSSQSRIGRMFARARLFLIPEEVQPCHELKVLPLLQKQAQLQPSALQVATTQGFLRAVLNPEINRLHRHLNAHSDRSKSATGSRFLLLSRTINNGPDLLTVAEKRRILRDDKTLWALHKWAWSLSQGELASKWFDRYRQQSM